MQTLAEMNSEFFEISMINEVGATKQQTDFPTLWSAITGIQFYNTVSGEWEWIG